MSSGCGYRDFFIPTLTVYCCAPTFKNVSTTLYMGLMLSLECHLHGISHHMNTT